MKPAPFDYHRPRSLEEALATLDRLGPTGTVMAGGQSLVPLMNRREVSPANIVDINSLVELSGITHEDRAVRVGALVRHAELERDAAVRRLNPLLAEAVPHIAHAAIRSRGTTVGSLVHADPTAEMPAVLVALGGSVELRSAAGGRTVPATEFFLGANRCCAAVGELAVASSFPVPPPRTGTAWMEVARQRGGRAVCGVAAVVTLDAGRRVVRATATYAGVGATPVLVDLTEVMTGARFDDLARWRAAADEGGSAVAPADDLHASAAYRRHLARVLADRAGRLAAIRATGA